MNTRIKSSDNGNWILCRSKKNCPGKLYYFNILTGDAVWKINDEEKSKENNLNPDNLNISFHEYPEPSSPDHQEPDMPPTNNFRNTSNNGSVQSFPNRNILQTFPPMFGQNFQKCPEQFMPITNVMWMPMPIPAPTWPCFERKTTLDKVTQTQKDGPILVEASKTPLCQRFAKYAKSSNSNTNKPIIFSSTPIKNLNESSRSLDTVLKMGNCETEIRKSNLDRSDLRYLLVAKRRKLEEEFGNCFEKKKRKIQEPLSKPKKKVTFNFDNLSVERDNESDGSGTIIITDPRVMRSTEPYTPLSPPRIMSNDISMTNKQVYCNITQNDIPIYNMPDISDEINDSSKMTGHLTNDKIQKTELTNNNYNIQFKDNKNQFNVTNNSLLNENDMANENDLANESNMANCSNMTNDSAESNNVKIKNKNVTYLVVDMDILLDDFAFIDELLQSDEKYKLLIPHSLRSEIEALCIGNCRGQQRVLIARQLSRKMAYSHKQYTVEPPVDDHTENTTDSILNCCQRAVKNNDCVILIANDPYLISKAKKLNINCYKPQEIKNGVLKNAELFTDLHKIKITVENIDDQNNKNDLNEKNNKENCWPVNMYKKQLFSHEGKPKNCDILINITKPSSLINKNIDNIECKNVGQKFELPENFEINQRLENIKISNQSFFDKPTEVINKGFEGIPETNNFVHNSNITNDKNENNNTNIITTGSKYRIEKIMNSIVPKTPKHPDENIKPVSTNKTSAPFESWRTTDNVRSNFKNTTLPLEERLDNFCVRSKAMHDKVKTRMDEWTCTYTQIMEELLNSILQNSSEYMNKICVGYRNLQESLTCIKTMFDNTELRDVVKVLIGMLAKCTCNKGKLKLDTTPNDFMKIFGCGILLVHILKTILPEKEELTEYETSLETLLRNIECIDNDLDVDFLKPMTVCRSEVERDNSTRINFIKPTTDIISYLTKHYKEWSTYDERVHIEKTSPNENQFKVIRVTGQNTNMLRIDNNKNLLFPATLSSQENDGLPKEEKILNINLQNDTHNKKNIAETMTKETNKNNEKAELKMMKDKQEIECKEINKEPLDLDALNYSDINVDTDDMSLELGNNFSNQFFDNNDISNQNDASRKNDQIIKSISMLEDINSESNYAESVNKIVKDHISRKNGLKINNELYENYASNENDNYNLNNENYAEYNENYGPISENYGPNNENYGPNNENYGANNENYGPNSENYGPNSENCGPNNENYSDNSNQRDDSNDSGFENDSTQAYTVVKIFLKEISTTYKIIYEFVLSFVEELRGKDMSQERKNILHIKSSRCLQNLIAIIRQLRTIIKRESYEDTVLKGLLLTAGVEATSDKRITRYRQIVLKCLEQAQILENALKVIACITIEDLDAISNNADSISSSIRYLNVFE